MLVSTDPLLVGWSIQKRTVSGDWEEEKIPRRGRGHNQNSPTPKEKCKSSGLRKNSGVFVSELVRLSSVQPTLADAIYLSDSRTSALCVREFPAQLGSAKSHRVCCEWEAWDQTDRCPRPTLPWSGWARRPDVPIRWRRELDLV